MGVVDGMREPIAASNMLAPILMAAWKMSPWDAKRYSDDTAKLDRSLKRIELQLTVQEEKGRKTSLCSEDDTITLGDIAIIGNLIFAFKFLLDPEWRAKLPKTQGWVERVTALPEFKGVYVEPIVFCEKDPGAEMLAASKE